MEEVKRENQSEQDRSIFKQRLALRHVRFLKEATCTIQVVCLTSISMASKEKKKTKKELEEEEQKRKEEEEAAALAAAEAAAALARIPPPPIHTIATPAAPPPSSFAAATGDPRFKGDQAEFIKKLRLPPIANATLSCAACVSEFCATCDAAVHIVDSAEEFHVREPIPTISTSVVFSLRTHVIVSNLVSAPRQKFVFVLFPPPSACQHNRIPFFWSVCAFVDSV
jgi:hypothetical protein